MRLFSVLHFKIATLIVFCVKCSSLIAVLKRGSFLRIRFIQVTLLFFMLFIQFGHRQCFSVAIVAMTSTNTSSNPNVPTYNWNNTSIILSSFYWSYVILQFLVGNLLQKFGTKWLLFVSVFMNSVGSVMIPVSAKYFGSNGVMICRIVQGFFQGVMLPLMNSALGRWVPPQELSLATSIIYLGNAAGIILAMTITGYLSASYWGWPSAFYVLGICGFIWCIFWFLLFSNTPASHQFISLEERKYIEQSLDQQDDYLIIKQSVPWKAIFKSLPYWAIIVASIGESWGSTYMCSELPNYFSNAVGLNIEDSSLFSSAPIVGSLVAGMFFGPIADYTIRHGHISTANSRRVFHGLASFSTTTGLVLLPFIENRLAVLIILTVSSAFGAGITLGHLINSIDISPRYAGVLCGISNGFGQLVAISAPVLVHFVVTDETNVKLWRIMFIVAAVINSVTAIFFIIFCSGERQWWDGVDQEKLKTENGKHHSKYTEGETNKCFVKDC